MAIDRILDVIHGYWAYLVLLILLLASLNALIKYIANKPFGAKDFRISLFGLIVTHIQVLVGLILYFAHPTLGFASITRDDMTMADVMGNSELRMFAVEHPLIMIIAIILITIGYSKHKKQLTSKGKFKILAIFYTLGLILILSRIPWDHWLSS
jgi:NADH:ubiquinone oxidoreductase subunit 2 (subunit N)